MKTTAMFWYLWSTPLVFSMPQQSHRRYDAAKLEIKQDSEARDVSMDLPHQPPPTASVFKEAATYRVLPPKVPVAQASKDEAAYEHLPPRSPAALLKDSDVPHNIFSLHPLPSELSDDTYEQKAHVFSDVSNDYYEDESLEYFDEDTENSFYHEVAEDYGTEEEAAEADDEIELTDDFLMRYLSNEALDIETEVDTMEEEASDH